MTIALFHCLEPESASPSRNDGDGMRESAAFCDVEVIRSRVDFNALEADWNDLFVRSAPGDQLFQSFNWLWHWANHFLDDEDALRIVAGRRAGRLVMVWPLKAANCFGLTKLVWMGEPVSPYGDALVEPGPLAEATLFEGWRRVQSLGADVAHLRKVRSGAAAHKIIAAYSTPCEIRAAPFADLRVGNFETLIGRQSSKTRANRRRALRRLEATGALSFSDPTAPVDAPALVRRTFEIKRDWLSDKGRISPTIESDAALSFFLDAASDPQRPVQTLFDTVSCNGIPIAVAISFAHKSEAFGHILAHRPERDKCGVGALLVEHVMRSSIERGMARFDMLAPADGYKLEWAHGVVPVADHIVSFTLGGRLFARLWTSAARQRLKQALQKPPKRLGRALRSLLRRLKDLRAA